MRVLGRRGLAAAAALAAASVGVVAGCGGGSGTSADPMTVTVTETEVATVVETEMETETVTEVDADEAQTVAPAAVTTVSGEYASFEYPSSWVVETSEAWKGSETDGYFDTTIRSPRNRDVMVRVDVSPEAFSDPSDKALEVEAYLRRQSSYRRLAFEPTTFAGHEAFHWAFEVVEDGVPLRKEDTFFTTGAGDTYAVLIQAPAGRFDAWSSLLDAVRASITTPGTDADVAYATGDAALGEGAFCETHDCIDYFDEGVGDIVQCADGMWSHSGGRPGACSHHGGVAGGSSDGYASGSDYDSNGDGSAYNWCGASRDGDGDGLWCEGR
jgi:hypothetical protein